MKSYLKKLPICVCVLYEEFMEHLGGVSTEEFIMSS
jgi:hypothetical protein